MTTPTLERVLKILKEAIKQWEVPAVGQIAEEKGDRGFLTLISTILSARTKDTVTIEASRRLLRKANTPKALAALSVKEIETLIYPVGFYKTKAKNVRETARLLEEQYGGEVPRDLDELIKLPGVGRKTANLVVTIGFDTDGICVDTHVHRITNLFGYLKTKTPEETEFALREKLPRKEWKTYNDILVTFGQNLCVPISPWCSRCPVEKYCEKVGLKRSR